MGQGPGAGFSHPSKEPCHSGDTVADLDEHLAPTGLELTDP